MLLKPLAPDPGSGCLYRALCLLCLLGGVWMAGGPYTDMHQALPAPVVGPVAAVLFLLLDHRPLRTLERVGLVTDRRSSAERTTAVCR